MPVFSNQLKTLALKSNLEIHWLVLLRFGLEMSLKMERKSPAKKIILLSTRVVIFKHILRAMPCRNFLGC